MKFFLTPTVLLILSCSSNKSILSINELSEWNVKVDTIYHKNIPIVVYDHFEYELNPSHGKAKPIIELSIKKLDSSQDELESLIRYIHTKHSKQKVEIVVPKN